MKILNYTKLLEQQWKLPKNVDKVKKMLYNIKYRNYY